jgi:hypothetical protein
LLPLIERRHQPWLQQLKEWKGETAQTDILDYEVDELISPLCDPPALGLPPATLRQARRSS